MKIFISYRWQDSTSITGRIYDRLVAAFGERAVFRDIKDIPPGKDIRTFVDNEVGKCNIMLVIIGPQWAGITDSQGNKRLFHPDDLVRIEAESGLKRKDILVIPVRAMGASMPAEGELPESLKKLVHLNAPPVRNDPDFDHDMQTLIQEIKKSVPFTQRLVSRIGLGVTGFLLLALVIFAGLKILGNASPDNPNSSLTFVAPVQSTGVSDIAVAAGFGARGNGWQLYFTNPTNNQNPATMIDASKLVNTTIIASRSVSVYEQPNQDSMIIERARAKDEFLVTETSSDSLWLHVRLPNDTEGWMQTQDVVLVSATPLAPLAKSQYGINIRLVDAIGRVKNTLDIAAFTLNEKEITNAILEAHQNGVIIRIVTDSENGLEGTDSTLPQLIAAGIPVVADNRESLMHNKFMILDGASVWTGSWNYSQGSTFNNNENALVFTSPQIASYYQIEFNKMFEAGEFGTRKTPNENPQVTIGDGTVRVYFAPDDNIPSTIIALLSNAQKSIRLMAFSFRLSDYADAIIQALQRGVKFQGIFEGVGVESGEAPRLQSAGADIRRDGNQYLLHHDVFIIDDAIVITGSMGFSQSASEVNDENMLIISDVNLANAYNDEFDRLWNVATNR